ncbi:MAG: cupin [Phycisphaeraceae bacterium]|nr:MAG: cupin [Phycisphaeraceae bacterium]
MIDPINIAEKLATFEDAFNPRILAECNGHEVRAAKLRGPFVWHAHADDDELFLVVDGAMLMKLREDPADPEAVRTLVVREGEFILIPRGVEHLPSSHPPESTCSVLIFEPAGVVNTGTATGTADATNLTRDALERI